MPKVIKPLTLREVQCLTKTTVLGGIPGFSLKIQKNNQKSYILRLPVGNGKFTEKGLGGYYQITYDEARQRAAEIYQRVVKVLSPKVVERKISALEELQKTKELNSRTRKDIGKKIAISGNRFATLEQLFYGWIETQRNKRKLVNLEGVLARYCSWFTRYLSEKIRKKRANLIKTDDIVAEILPIWQEKPHSARKFLGVLRRVFDWGMSHEYIKYRQNPISLHQDSLFMEQLPAFQDEYSHNGAPAVKDVPLLIRELLCSGRKQVLGALYAILTSMRPGAVNKSFWSEIDLGERIHTVPRARMKIKGLGFDRRIPITDELLFILKLAKQNNISTKIFQSSETTCKGWFRKIAKENNIFDPQQKNGDEPRGVTIHGTARACFKAWARDGITYGHREYAESLIERCLDHREGFSGAYVREQPIGEQRQIYEDWNRYCFSLIDYDLKTLKYRRRSKPKKVKPQTDNNSQNSQNSGKRPVGRPRKPRPEVPEVKRPWGRPRKNPVPTPETTAENITKSQIDTIDETTKSSQGETL